MEKIVINVDWVSGNFAAAAANEEIACVATGKTLDEVRHNIVDAIRFHLEGMQEDGEFIPHEFSGEWEPEFHLTTRAQLKYSDNYITRKALSRETGIAEQQLSHYANGQRHPRPDMQRRIHDGILAISRRLSFIL
ncbi:MAG: type II toxin-antitoxin system HicB family antitoxin [Bacteroidales bacterium]|nr:type II toxin-antitoxin system HicB family antitoxin [Bacteroidales bacterium]